MSKKIAIIGSGVAGLATAWLLSKDYEVSLFEKKPTLGMGHKGIFVETAAGQQRIDIPPRVINANHYIELFKLLGEIELEAHIVKQEACFSNQLRNPYLAFKTYNYFQKSFTVPKFQTNNLKWMIRHTSELLRWISYLNGNSKTEPNPLNIEEFVHSLGYTREFYTSFLMPMWSLMCTCNAEQLKIFPSHHLIEIFKSFGTDTPSQRIKGGTEALELKLTQALSNVYLSKQVKGIENQGNQLKLVLADTELLFDHIIIATEPFFAAKFLNDEWRQEKEILEKVPYTETTMVMHTDSHQMPLLAKDWAPVNIFVNHQTQDTSATLWMNKLESETTKMEAIFQSWDPKTEIPAAKKLAKRVFKRSLTSADSEVRVAHLRDMMKTQAHRKLWFVGSYMAEGVPLLENGVHSANFVNSCIRAATPS